jgi:GNAT superfamily N-acetyltransferase
VKGDHNNRSASPAPPVLATHAQTEQANVNTLDESRIRVVPVDAALRPALLGLGVLPAQRDWVRVIADLLADVALCPGSEPMAILRGDTPVGYYRIEPSARSVAGRDFAVPALGLRAFFIDVHWQGRGVGTQALAALIVDLAERHPQARLLVLTVNCNNHAALQLYLRAGFTDSGELYHGGRSGPQHLLLRVLP